MENNYTQVVNMRTWNKMWMVLMLVWVQGCEYVGYIFAPSFDPYQGYSSPWQVRVETDARYTISVAGRDLGSRSQTQGFPLQPGECFHIQKTSPGYIRVFVTYSNWYEGGAFPRLDDRSTTGYWPILGCAPFRTR